VFSVELFDELARRMVQNREFSGIFTPEVIDRLAELGEREYDSLKLQLEAHLILNQIEIDGLKNLDKLVRAAHARLEEKRSRLPLIPLKEQLPDAPHADNLRVPPGWLLATDGVYRTDAEGAPRIRASTSPAYPAAKRLDPDRRRARLLVAVHAGEWRTTSIPASLPGKKAASAATDMGALVPDANLFAAYWEAFLKTNWDRMPSLGDDYALYEELVAFILDNADRISETGPWGKLVDGQGGTYLALKPDVVRKFARNAGVDCEHLLTSLREKGFLLTDGNSRLKTVWFNGRARRMVAVVWEKERQCAQRSWPAHPGGDRT
jgi:hypothetical protein